MRNVFWFHTQCACKVLDDQQRCVDVLVAGKFCQLADKFGYVLDLIFSQVHVQSKGALTTSMKSSGFPLMFSHTAKDAIATPATSEDVKCTLRCCRSWPIDFSASLSARPYASYLSAQLSTCAD